MTMNQSGNFTPTHKLKPGFGYWDATQYPVGGKFCRAPHEGAPILLQQTGAVVPCKYGRLARFVDSDNRSLYIDDRGFEPIDNQEQEIESVAQELGDDFAAFRRGYFLAVGFKASDYEGKPIFECLGGDFAEVFDSSEIETACKDSGQFAEMLADAIDFYTANLESMRLLGENFERFGGLFHYSRNGHGVCWMDDYDNYPQARELQEASRIYGSLELEC